MYCVILGEFRLLYETQDYHNSNEATNLSVLYCLQFQACSMGLCVIDNNNVVQLKQILVILWGVNIELHKLIATLNITNWLISCLNKPTIPATTKLVRWLQKVIIIHLLVLSFYIPREWCLNGISQSPLLELTTLNIEILFKTPWKTSPVRRSPATQMGHAQIKVAGLAISSPLIITTQP